MLYTGGPITGWFFYSKQSVFFLRRELELFVRFTLIFVVKGGTVCRALKEIYPSSCRFREQPRERLFTSASVHLSSLPLGINWFCCSICRLQYYNHHHHLALGIRLQMWHLVLCVYNILNPIVVFHCKIRKVQMHKGSYWSLRRIQGHRCLLYRRDLFNWRLHQTTWYCIIVEPTSKIPVLSLLITKEKEGLIWTGRPIFTKLHVNTVRS